MRIKAPHRRSLLFVLLAGFCSLGTPLQAADLTIGHAEITQGLQDDKNDIPLVRHKPTVVRVFPVISGTTDRPQVSALLHASRHGSELPESPRRPDRGTVSAALAVDRKTDESALIFEVPFDWTSEATKFWVELEPLGGFVDDEPANNRHLIKNGDPIEFLQTRPLDIRFVKVRFRNGGPDRLPESRSARQDAVGWLRAIFPIAPEDVKYQPWISTEVTFENSHPSGQPDPSQDLAAAELISELNTLWEGTTPPDLLYAWTPSGSFSRNGKSDPWFRLAPYPPGLGKVALGNSNGDRYRRTLAHEMAHNLGINCHHQATLENDLIGYDVTSTDPTAESVRLHGAASGTARFDVMKPGEIEANAWIVPWTYRNLLTALTSRNPRIVRCSNTTTVEGDQETGFPAAAVALPAGTERLLAIRGEIHEDGGSFFPFYDVPAQGALAAAAELVPGDRVGRYEVRFISEGGTILQRIRWSPPNDLDDSDSPAMTPTPFTWLVPRRDDVGAVLLFRGNTLLASRFVREQKPQIETPQLGTVHQQVSFDGPLQELRKVSWKEIRSGSPGDPFDNSGLRHRLLFSNNNGANWIPVAANLASSPDGEIEVEVDQALLPGGPSCLFKVVTSDGYNNTEKVSEAFSLPNRAPAAEILSPRIVSTVPAGAALRLVGEAYDPEGRDLQLQWWEGPTLLGSGPVLVLPNLPPRTYQIHLKAIDDAHNVTETESVTIDIVPQAEP